MTADYDSIESILAFDCGSTVTRAVLIDDVNGEPRFIAHGESPSTVAPPWNNVMASVRQALAQVSDVTQARFLDSQQRIICPEREAGGVDAVVATTSAGEPLRLVLTGIVQDVSLQSARRALSATYTMVEGTVSASRLDGGVLIDDIEGQLQLIREHRPDAVIIVGGVDGGASRPVLQAVQATALACSLLPQAERPTLIYAGNTELRTQVAEAVGAIAELHSIDNVRPSINVENAGPLQAEVEQLYRERKMERIPGLSTLTSWSPVPILPTSTAFGQTIQYLARLDGINVLGVDIGGASSTVAAVVDDRFDLLVRSDLGTGCHTTNILEHVPAESITRWLPFELDPVQARNMLHNNALHHHTVPQTREDLLVEEAVAREILRFALSDMGMRWLPAPSRMSDGLPPRLHLIVGSGGVLARAPTYGQAALVLLDALQPLGVCGLALDRVGLLAAMGAVAMVNPLAAAQVTARDALLNLGTVVAPIGVGREGETALTFGIEYDDGRSLQVEVAYGSLEVVPLPTGQTANLELRPTRHFDVGLGTRGRAGMTRVEGGAIGIIIDARGRPLPLAQDPAQQLEKMQRWLWDVGA
jgi:uncharacterized protein (TIGR01319 family)